MSSAIIIRTTNEIEVVDYPKENGYEFLREIVGGFIEGIDFNLAGMRCNGYINEEGKLENLTSNPIATTISWAQESIQPWDYIAGNLVIVRRGRGDSERGFTDAEIKDVLAYFSTLFAIEA